ncbi:MAG TPA: isopentenyl-diphosphate Delta-isomerase [Longimicrobium sp.]|jgi:isopentenyl-diphosphate delta-isomerase|nr:isopentenyl-diphosphate Delta-isomerase [Longimicrobium sp.]
MLDAAEMVVLVDEGDREVGLAPKLAAHADGVLHRAFSVFVLNARGEVMLQRRALGKYHSGGLWTNSCCGHPRAGEPVAAAARRRLHEEMGFDCELTHVRGFVYQAEVGGGLLEHEYDHVFIGRHDADPVPDPAEVCEWRWQSPAAALAEAEAHPERFTPWFPLALRELIAGG